MTFLFLILTIRIKKVFTPLFLSFCSFGAISFQSYSAVVQSQEVVTPLMTNGTSPLFVNSTFCLFVSFSATIPKSYSFGDGINIHQHLIFHPRNPVIHRIVQLTGKYGVLRKTHLLPLPFFHQLRDVLFGRRLEGTKKKKA